jgi:hypothetical protein
MGAPQGYGIALDPSQTLSVEKVTILAASQTYVVGSPKIFVSDDVSHNALRQTALKRTFWRFDYGSGELPRYGYAEVLAGDIIADNPPNT